MDSSVLKELQIKLRPETEKILQEELGAETSKKAPPLFFFKKRQAITVYYVNQIGEKNNELIFSKLDVLKIKKPKNITLTTEIKFFGEKRVNSIKDIVKDLQKEDSVIERIKEKLIKLVSEAIVALPVASRKILFHKLNVYDQQKRIYVKEYKLWIS